MIISTYVFIVILCLYFIYAIRELQKLNHGKFINIPQYNIYQKTIQNNRTDADANDYINFESYTASVGFDVRKSSMVSNTLVGGGILGTFIGLSFGINGMDMSGSTNEIQQGIDHLLAGMSMAFITSIFGMLFSIGYSWYEKRVYGKIHKALEKMCTESNMAYYVPSVVIVGEKMGQAAGESISTPIVNLLSEKLNIIVQNIEETLGELPGLLSTSAQQLVCASEKIEESSVSLRDTAVSLKNTGSSLQTIDQQMSVSAVQLSDAATELGDAFVQLQNGLTPVIDSIKNNIGDMRSITVSQLNNITEHRRLSQDQLTISERNRQATEQITTALTTIGNIPDEMQIVYENMQAQTCTYIQDLNTFTNKILTDYSTQFTKSCEAVNNTTNNLSDTLNQFHAANNEIAEKLGQTADLLDTMIKNIPTDEKA